MRKFNIIIFAVLSALILCSFKSPDNVLTFKRANITNFDDFTDPTRPFVWLHMDLEDNGVSYSLVLQLNLPVSAEMPGFLGKPQTLSARTDGEAFSIRSGFEVRDTTYESYLIRMAGIKDIAILPVVAADGTITINSWNGYDADELCSMDIGLSVTTESGDKLDFKYNGTVTLNFFSRVRARSKNPACADTNLYFRNIGKSDCAPRRKAPEGMHYNALRLSNDDGSRSIDIAFLEPDDADSPKTKESTFNVCRKGSYVTLNGVRHAVKGGTVTAMKYRQKKGYTKMEGTLTGKDGKIYKFAFITKPSF